MLRKLVCLTSFGEFARGQVAERSVWSVAIVVVLPAYQGGASMFERSELGDVQALVA